MEDGLAAQERLKKTDLGRRNAAIEGMPDKPITQSRDMYEPDLHIDTLKATVGNFR
jgi:hypothetical protein